MPSSGTAHRNYSVHYGVPNTYYYSGLPRWEGTGKKNAPKRQQQVCGGPTPYVHMSLIARATNTYLYVHSARPRGC